MFDAPLTYINERFNSFYQAPEEMDALWNDGWRNFGVEFFRYSLTFYLGEIQKVIPLRIRLADFTFSESQRRVLRKNANLQVKIRPADITPEKEALFQRHKVRFRQDVPFSIYNFLSAVSTATLPCNTNEVCIYDGDRILAVSFLGIGTHSTSATYAMFEPEESKRSLGILMILKEIEYSIEQGKDYLHLGYAYEGPSFYDYKKRFSALESYDWQGNWFPFEKS